MSELSRLLGSILADIAHARRIADQETAAIAEYYRSNPLLEGMSLPRIRIPEIVIDLPMLIEGATEGEPSILEEPEQIVKEVREEILTASKNAGLKITDSFLKLFEKRLRQDLERLQKDDSERGYPRESVIRATDSAFSSAIIDRQEKITPAQIKRLAEVARQKAGQVSLRKAGLPPSLVVNIKTEDIKLSANAGVVTRLKLVLKEEGLEWSVGEKEDGTQSRKLLPE